MLLIIALVIASLFTYFLKDKLKPVSYTHLTLPTT
mgnify:CR=1 FL=1